MKVLQGRILVVEDEPDIRELLGDTLSVLGPVELATDGVDALERIQRNGAPAVILLDLCLPRMTGPELIERLRGTAYGDVPVVSMTASNARAPAGVREHLHKPFDIDDAIGALVRATSVAAAAA